MSLRLRLRTAGLTGGSLGGALGGGRGKQIPAAAFGMHVANLAPTTIWADYFPSNSATYFQVPIPQTMGLGAIRLWDSNGVNWRSVERSRGVYTWDRLDNAVALATAAGLDMIYTLGCGPDWATTNPGQRPGYYLGYNPWPPADNAYWSEWCTAVGTRFAGRGMKYEIWNEVNDQTNGTGATGSGFVGTVAQLVTLAQLAKAAISAVDPTAKFLTPNFVGQDGIVSTPGACTLDAYLAAGGAAYADVISVHGYNTCIPWPRPEGLITLAKRVRDTCANRGVALPVWNSEWGYGTWQDSTGVLRSQSGSTPFPDTMVGQMGADYIVRMMLLSWCGGFERFYFYGLDATQSYAAIVMVNPTSADAARTLLTPALAFGYVARLLAGGYLSDLGQQVSADFKLYYRAGFTAGDGRTGFVYWCDDNAAMSAPTPGAVSATDCLGNALTVGATLAVTSSPKFVFYT